MRPIILDFRKTKPSRILDTSVGVTADSRQSASKWLSHKPSSRLQKWPSGDCDFDLVSKTTDYKFV